MCRQAPDSSSRKLRSLSWRAVCVPGLLLPAWLGLLQHRPADVSITCSGGRRGFYMVASSSSEITVRQQREVRLLWTTCERVAQEQRTRISSSEEGFGLRSHRSLTSTGAALYGKQCRRADHYTYCGHNSSGNYIPPD